jgi:MFS family permease
MTQPERRLVALRYHDFRLIWGGELVSTIGSQMQLTAVNWHVYQLLSGKTAAFSLFGNSVHLDSAALQALGLGTLGLARVLPIIVFALVGGVLADAMDRRQLMLWTRIIATVLAGALAWVTLAGQDTVFIIYLLTAAGAAATAFDNPARQSLVPNLVAREHLANAVSLNTLMFQIATVAGPAIAGVMIAKFNIGWVYAINATTFVVAAVAVLLIRYRGKPASLNTGMGWGAMVEGLRFTYRSRIIWGTMLLDFFATFFSSARTMLPIIADQILHVGAEGYGLLSAAQPVGAVLAGTIMALRSRELRRQGEVLLWSVVIYGIATALLGVSLSFLISFVMLALTGAGDTVSTVIRGTIRQIMTPDELRGRMTSVNMIFFMGGPQLGELEAGVVAAAFGAPFSILTGGIATVLLTAWIAWKYPRLRQYDGEVEAKAA